jgi:hypothetical protein
MENIVKIEDIIARICPLFVTEFTWNIRNVYMR